MSSIVHSLQVFLTLLIYSTPTRLPPPHSYKQTPNHYYYYYFRHLLLSQKIVLWGSAFTKLTKDPHSKSCLPDGPNHLNLLTPHHIRQPHCEWGIPKRLCKSQLQFLSFNNPPHISGPPSLNYADFQPLVPMFQIHHVSTLYT